MNELATLEAIQSSCMTRWSKDRLRTVALKQKHPWVNTWLDYFGTYIHDLAKTLSFLFVHFTPSVLKPLQRDVALVWRW